MMATSWGQRVVMEKWISNEDKTVWVIINFHFHYPGVV